MRNMLEGFNEFSKELLERISRIEKILKIKEKCPFCGNINQDEFAIHEEKRLFNWVSYNVTCSCGARGPDADTTEKAIEAWNRGIGRKKAMEREE